MLPNPRHSFLTPASQARGWEGTLSGIDPRTHSEEGRHGVSEPPGLGADGDLRRTIRRNTVLLAASMALGWAVVQLMAVVGAPILSEITGRPALAGLAPAMFVFWWAVATLGAGRYMDVRGRTSGIRLGFVAAAAGSLLVYLGTDRSSLPLFLVGMALAGGGLGAVNLARAGGADMYPPERRAHGISLVLVGAAFGAILGPVAFIPLLGGRSHELHTLAAPWTVAALVMVGGALLTLAIRVDPLEIGRSKEDHTGHHHEHLASDPARPLRVLLGEPVVRVAVVAAVIAQTVMTSMMGIVSLVLHDHGHGWRTVAVSLSAHFLGMFGLVLVVGHVVDRIGRGISLVIGLVVLAAGVLLLLAEIELGWVAPAMFLIGIGWNVAFVAATTMLSDATEPSERARLLGFSDFTAFSAAAIGSLLAGVVLDMWGLRALVGFGAGLSVLPVLVFVIRHPERRLRGVAKQA